MTDQATTDPHHYRNKFELGAAVAQYRRVAVDEAKLELETDKLERMVRGLSDEVMTDYVRLTSEVDKAIDAWHQACDNSGLAPSTIRQYLGAFVGKAGFDRG